MNRVRFRTEVLLAAGCFAAAVLLGQILLVGLVLAASAVLPASAAAQTISVPDDFVPALSDTRATGSYAVEGTGLRITTKGNTSTDKVAECTQFGQKMRIPPVMKDETFDLWWVPKDQSSMPVRMVENLAVSLDQDEVVVKTEDHLGLLRLVGNNLPATKQVFLASPQYGQLQKLRDLKQFCR